MTENGGSNKIGPVRAKLQARAVMLNEDKTSRPTPRPRPQCHVDISEYEHIATMSTTHNSENSWSFRPLQSRAFPTEADATVVGSCVDFSCFSSCQLVNAMIPSLIALLTWQLAAWLAFALVEPRPRTRMSISKQSTRYHIYTRSLDVSDLSSCRNS